MNSFYMVKWSKKTICFLCTVFLMPSTQYVLAQDDSNDPAFLLMQTGPRSSPFDPGESNDTRFIVDDAPGLDTRCTFRSGGPLIFEIEVTRYVGPVNPDGTLQDPVSLKDIGIVFPTATLRMPAFDVDYGASLPAPYDPERDRVFFNGTDIGYLTGFNNIWKLNIFTIPIELLKFPDKGATTPAKNTIRIDIDVANIDIGQELWCTAIDWAELSFQAVRPVLLVHGILTGPETWTDEKDSPWFSNLENALIPVDTVRVGIMATIQSNSALIASKVSTMRSQYGVDRINIVSHSKGGLDSRDYINTHDDIEQLIMISTPNAGTPVADFIQGLIILAGVPGVILEAFQGPAAAQLTTYYMNAYNLFVRENRKTRYIALAGNYDPNGGFLGLGPDGAVYLSGEDDEWVQVSSVHSLGYTDNRTFTTFQPDKLSTHTEIKKSQDVYNDLFVNLNQFGLSVSSEDSDIGPIVLLSHSSFSQPQRTASTIDLILPGEVKTHDLTIGHASQAFFQCVWGTGTLGFVLIDPAGNRIDPPAAPIGDSVEFQFTEILEGIKIKSYSVLQDPSPGKWTLEISGADVAIGGEHYAVGAFLNGSNVLFEAITDQEFYRNNDPVEVTASLERNSTPITAASVSARLMLPDNSIESIELFDDGTHGDLGANDGLYTNSFTNTSQSGLYRVLVTASQTGAEAFSRENALLVSVSSSRSEFDGAFGDVGSDTDGDGLFNELIFEIGVNVTEDGEYGVTGVLVDNIGNHIGAATAIETFGIGSQTLALSFDGFSIFANAVDGPYTLEELTLVEKTFENSTIVDFLVLAHTTLPYSFRDFQKPDIFFTGNSSDFGTDNDSNGKYDALTIVIEVDLSTADFYQWSANLIDVNGTVIDFAGNAGSLNSGVGTISLTFDGIKIGENGVNGPYVVSGMLMFGRSGANIVTLDVATTQAYSFTEFEGAVVLLGGITGTILADCPVPGAGLLGVPIDVYANSTGNLVGNAITDENGYFEILDVLAGDNTVTMVTPLGYLADSEEIPVNLPGGETVNVDFALTCADVIGEPRTIGFWKHQIGVAIGGNGHTQVDALTVCDYLDAIEDHFNNNSVNQVIIYQAPSQSADCGEKLGVAKELLNLKGSLTMMARARQQLMALLLNVAAEYILQTSVISEDGANVSQAITYCDNLIDDISGDHEKAKTIADLINNSITVPAGMIPLSTANIAYKQLTLPIEYFLGQNYPNPFNPITVISFALPEASDVKLEIYNIMGQKVATVADRRFEAGNYSVEWDGSRVASGVYFYKLTAGEFVETKKMVLLK